MLKRTNLSKAPIVSIIIPTYNTTQLLLAMIDCVLKQTYQKWELIIVDDCSTDNSYAEIQRAIKDSRIRIYQRNLPEKGSVVCRNMGFCLSKGKYIVHFDADDLISTQCLENRVRYMEAHPELDFAVFQGTSFAENMPNATFKRFGIKKGDVIVDFLKGDYPFSVWNIMFRKESIDSFYWDEKVKIYTDFSYIMPILFARLKYEFANNQEFDYFYRVGQCNSNMCASYVSKEKSKSTRYLFNNILNLIKLERKEDQKIYKSAFRHSLERHFVRLILSSDSKEITFFLWFIKFNYSIDFYYKLLIISKISLIKNCINLKKAVIYLFEALLFWKFDSIEYHVKRIRLKLLR